MAIIHKISSKDRAAIITVLTVLAISSYNVFECAHENELLNQNCEKTITIIDLYKDTLKKAVHRIESCSQRVQMLENIIRHEREQNKYNSSITSRLKIPFFQSYNSKQAKFTAAQCVKQERKIYKNNGHIVLK